MSVTDSTQVKIFGFTNVAVNKDHGSECVNCIHYSLVHCVASSTVRCIHKQIFSVSVYHMYIL